MSGLGDVSQILSGIQALSAVFQDDVTIFNFLVGPSGNSSVVPAIVNLTTVINNDLQNLTNAVIDAAVFTEWCNNYGGTLTDILDIVTPYFTDFGTLASPSNGTASPPDYVIISQGMTIPFDLWCNGGTVETTQFVSALTTLTNQATRLANLINLDAPGVPSFLTLYNQLYQLGSGPAPAIESFAGQTSLIAFTLLLQQTYTIIAGIFYCHEGALSLFATAYPKEGEYDSLSTVIANDFGGINVQNSVWGNFQSIMNNWPPIINDYQVIATSGDSFPGADAFQPIQTVGGGWSYFWPNMTSIVNLQNNEWTTGPAFFTGVQLNYYLNTNIAGFPIYYLSGDVSIIGPGLQITSYQTGMTSFDPSSITEMTQLIPLPGDYNGGFVAYANVAYAAPTPIPEGAGCVYNVVTGFAITTVNDNSCLALQLQYGQLNLNDPNNPTVSNFYMADIQIGNSFGVCGNGSNNEVSYIDLRPSGPSVPFPIDNISFVQTCPTSSGNRVGLIARSGWNVFQAVFMQPVNQVAPYGYKPSAASKAERHGS